MRTLLISFLLLPLLWAQETVAPTVNEPVGPPRGENQGDYNIVQSWELGYRYSLIGGDEGKYRSDVNFRQWRAASQQLPDGQFERRPWQVL